MEHPPTFSKRSLQRSSSVSLRWISSGKKIKPKLLETSIELIKSSGVPHEFRTTVVPELVDVEDIFEAKRLSGEKLTVQRFRNGDTVLDQSFKGLREHTDAEFDQLAIQVA